MSSDLSEVWPARVRLSEIDRGLRALMLDADDTVRAAVAHELDLANLATFTAEVRLTRWRDGVQIDADWSATLTRLCGLTLEPFAVSLAKQFRVRLAPKADAGVTLEELVLDLEADDPPDPLAGDVVEVGALLVEHLALELDPFPRAPGAHFEPPPESPEVSPFAALSALRPSR